MRLMSYCNFADDERMSDDFYDGLQSPKSKAGSDPGRLSLICYDMDDLLPCGAIANHFSVVSIV